jgi:quercetin dioxygenase-like cupin family protein
MARAGDEIYNPVQQDRVIWRKTARDTHGELLGADLFVSPDGGNPLHVHPRQEERFKAVSGSFGVQVRDERRWLTEGEEVIVPPGTPHRWWNDSNDEEAHVSVDLRPALNSEVFFETLYGLAQDGKTDENGAPGLLQQAVTLHGINRGEIYLASPPVPVQKVILAVLAPVGRLLGYRDYYQRYSGALDQGAGGAEPPSTASAVTRGGILVGSLLVTLMFLLGRVRRRNKG